MGVSENRGGPPKWMVYYGKPYKNGCFGSATILGNIQIHKIFYMISSWLHHDCRHSFQIVSHFCKCQLSFPKQGAVYPPHRCNSLALPRITSFAASLVVESGPSVSFIQLDMRWWPLSWREIVVRCEFFRDVMLHFFDSHVLFVACL